MLSARSRRSSARVASALLWARAHSNLEHPMNGTPRTAPAWFYVIIALYAVLATAAFSYERVAAARAARWVMLPGGSTLIDTWQGVVCGGGCRSLEAITSRVHVKQAAR